MKHNKPFYQQKGSTLIEAVVSMFVFAIGALGIASLQLASVVRTDDARALSSVVWKAQELVDHIRSSKTINQTDRSAQQAYLNVIANTGTTTIGTYEEAIDGNGARQENSYNCPMTMPVECNGAVQCNANSLALFNVWDVLCNSNSGLTPVDPTVEGSAGISGLEVALRANRANEYQLSFEWINRSSANSVDEDGIGSDSGLVNTDSAGSVRTVPTNLCGTIVNVDTRLDTYCVRFQL